MIGDHLGGISKGVFILRLNRPEKNQDMAMLSFFENPNNRQINDLGGVTSTMPDFIIVS